VLSIQVAEKIDKPGIFGTGNRCVDVRWLIQITRRITTKKMWRPIFIVFALITVGNCYSQSMDFWKVELSNDELKTKITEYINGVKAWSRENEVNNYIVYLENESFNNYNTVKQ
jgi:hypothetical protein